MYVRDFKLFLLGAVALRSWEWVVQLKSEAGHLGGLAAKEGARRC